MKRAFVTSAILALGLAVAIPVAAQQTGAGPGQKPGWGPHAGFARMCDDQDAIVAGKLAFAEKKLKITDAQKAAWTKFLDAVRTAQAPMAKLCTDVKGKPVPTTLPDRLEHMQAMANAGQATLAQIVPAAKELYAQLTPDQQKTADQLLPHRGMMGRGMMHNGGPMQGHPMMRQGGPMGPGGMGPGGMGPGGMNPPTPPAPGQGG